MLQMQHLLLLRLATEDANNGTFTQAAGFGAVTGTLKGFFGAGETFEFESATISTNGGAQSTLTAVGGLTITQATGALSFNPDHADYASLTQIGNGSEINVVYKVTSASGESFTNDFNIDLDVVDDGSGGTGNLVTITAPKILGQLTATDDDLRTTLKYEAVGAPVEGLVIDKDTGAWSFDPSNEAYQYLEKDETLAIQVEYSVTDEEGASDTNSFTITLTGTNDLPELTGVASTLPGGTEDQDYEITKLQLLAGYTDADLGETDSLKVEKLGSQR